MRIPMKNTNTHKEPSLQPLKRKSLTKPNSKPVPSVAKPRSKPNLEPEPSVSDLQYEITALKEENLKRARQVAKLKAENTSLKNDNTILTKNFAKYRHDNPPFDPSTMTEETREILDGYMKQLLKKQIQKSKKSPT